MAKIGNIKILGLDVVIQGERNSKEDYDFGALYLKLDNREYILDTVQTYWKKEDSITTIECALEKNEEAFDKCKYDLDEVDLISLDLEASFYIEGTFSNKIESITLFVEYDDTVVEIIVKEE